jgi:hypothetical protein
MEARHPAPRRTESEDQVNDRELLELAAKAAGITHTPSLAAACRGERTWWNPLTDDGDRYRLAKKLDIRLHFGPQYVTYVANGIAGTVRWPEDEADDARAIVRAAAEIGRNQQ